MQRTEHGVCRTLSAGRKELSVLVAGGGSSGAGDGAGRALRAAAAAKETNRMGRVLEQARLKNEILVKRDKWSW